MRHEEDVLFHFVIGITFFILFLMPIGYPATVDLSPEYHRSGIQTRMDVVNLDLSEGVVEPNAGTWPVAFANVDKPVDVVLCRVDLQIMPHLPDFHHILCVGPVEAILVLDLQHDYASLWVLGGPQMFQDCWRNCLEVDLCFRQVLGLPASQYQSINAQKTCRVSS